MKRILKILGIIIGVIIFLFILYLFVIGFAFGYSHNATRKHNAKVMEAALISPDECLKGKGGFSIINQCYEYVAKQTRSPSLCERSVGFEHSQFPEDSANHEKDRCYDSYAEFTEDVSFCKTWSCFKDFAFAKNDITICEKISDINQKENLCYYSFAQIFDDKSICDTKITIPEIKNKCYEFVTKAYCNSDTFSDPEERKKCFEYKRPPNSACMYFNGRQICY